MDCHIRKSTNFLLSIILLFLPALTKVYIAGQTAMEPVQSLRMAYLKTKVL